MKRPGEQFEQFGPRGTRMVTRESEDIGSRGEYDTYRYAKENPEPEDWNGWETHQTLGIGHTPPKTGYADWQGNTSASGGLRNPDHNHLVREAHEEISDNQMLAASSSKPRQLKLFGMGYEPGRSKVEYMGGTREGRVMTGTMLGIAQNDTMRERGRGLEPSEDLSEHSSKLVGNLRKKGVVAGEGTPEITNDLQFDRFPEPLHGFGYSEQTRLPHAEVMAGRETARRILRGGKGKGNAAG